MTAPRSTIEGAAAVRAELGRVVAEVEDLAIQTLEEQGRFAHAEGIANINAMLRRRSGLLRRNYRFRRRRRGLEVVVGFTTARARRRVFYARFVHDGTVDLPARPFHRLAIEAAEKRFAARWSVIATLAAQHATRRRR